MSKEAQQPGTPKKDKNTEDFVDITDSDQLRGLINQLDSADDFNGCLTLCEKALKVFEGTEFLILRAKYEILLGIFEDANETLRNVLNKEPKNAEATAMLGFNFYHQGKLLSALQTYQSALALKPGMIEAETNRKNAQNLWDIFATGELSILTLT